MVLFNDNFYTQDFDQEMLDWIGSNHIRHMSPIEGEWDAEGTKLEYYREFNYFWTSNALGDTEELTKEQFKEKIGMPNETATPLVTRRNTMSKYRVRIYVSHGYFEYEVSSKEQAMAHGQAIMASGVYRRVNDSDEVEFYTPYKVKVCGDDLGTAYGDKFVRT